MFTRKPGLQLGKIVISSAKRLLQHYRHKADIRCTENFVGKRRYAVGLPRLPTERCFA